MKKDILQRAKGVRDFGPEQEIQRQGLLDILKTQFEIFGFSPIETPVLERYDLLASKFGQGDQSEAMAETFKLKDQGKRDLVLRNEFTVSLARYVGMNPNLKMPFKRYQIGQVFRDGPIKLGRYRQFYQCDVDIVGVKDISAEVELINLALKIFDELKLEIFIQVNNRKLLNDLLDFCNVSDKDKNSVIIILDKLEKIGKKGVQKELKDNKIVIKNFESLIKLLKTEKTNDATIQKISKEVKNSEGLKEIKEMLSLIKNKNIIFTPSLARGLSYYTGTIFEVFLKDKKILTSALAGGGRYDDMIGGFLDKKEKIPAIGISFGLETIWDVLTRLKRFKAQKTVTQLYILGIGIEKEKLLEIIKNLRTQDIKVDWDLMQRNFKKNLNYADALNIPYVGIIGEDELKKNKIMLKNMKTGKQEILSFEKIVNIIKQN